MTPPEAVRERALSAALPAYVYDLDGLGAHAAAIRAAVPAELFYAAKANPEVPILTALAPHVDGFEVSSGGELAHVRQVLPKARVAFGGPGKTEEELAAAAGPPVHRIHVESPGELRRLAALRREADVLLRVNLPVAAAGASLRMSGPFGMDAESLGTCLDLLAEAPWLRPRGMHAHLASGLEAGALLEVAAQVLGWARSWSEGPLEVNLGGGMAVDYRDPGRRFDWAAYGAGLAALRRPDEVLRIEPGRAVTAYCGWYVTDVLDVKRTHGESYAVLRGGTHHLRTPVAKGHDQPFTVLPAGAGPSLSGPVTLVGQLCTPKDVLARQVPVERLATGDVVAFAMAGAYAWNISHHDFLMHPKPSVHYVGVRSG
ncbi:alanine racemase [Actinomadura sp. DC4]|uniref:alanine racemase n=1 Tax=Actinomadura sp. DC4 TaxID=3055069 RepID=UPI0025B1B0C0|nr:alanine racemase [Actinomadura sp. DC4]MDN3352743.1 alanine racemase [Actinomadura sp. DC4]